MRTLSNLSNYDSLVSEYLNNYCNIKINNYFKYTVLFYFIYIMHKKLIKTDESSGIYQIT